MNERATTASAGSVRAVVIFGDVVASRRAPAVASAWLRRVCGELDALYGRDRLAPFAFTQGDELQGLLTPSADPMRGVLHASLHEDAQPMRWVVIYGHVEPGPGRATERGGEAYVRARGLIGLARRQRDGLLIETGDIGTDALLGDVAPVLAELLAGLSRRQRTVARLVLTEGLRQSDVAERLDVSRATVSVTFARAGVRSIQRLSRAVRTLFRLGVEAAGA